MNSSFGTTVARHRRPHFRHCLASGPLADQLCTSRFGEREISTTIYWGLLKQPDNQKLPMVKLWMRGQEMLQYPPAWFVEWAHGNGHPQAAGEARGHLDCAQRVGVGAGTSVLSAAKRVAGGRALRRICRRAGREVLCGQVRAAVADAGDLLPLAADRVFRGHRQRAWDCLAVGGLAGAAALCGHRAGRDDAGPLDDFAHAAADRCGDTSRGIWLGAGRAGLRGLLKGQRIAIDATTLEANAAMRPIC